MPGMKSWRFVYKNFLPILCIVIFVSTLVPKLFLDGLSTSDDPYYHAAHAAAYYFGEPLILPQFSPLATHPTDPWYLYHWGMVPFIAMFASQGAPGVLLASKIYHAVLATGMFALFFVIVRSTATALIPLYEELLARTVPRAVPPDAFARPQSVAIGSVVFLFLYDLGSVSDFIHRTLTLDRPHVVMIGLVLVAFWALVHRRVWTMLAVSGVAALTYSISVLILLPVCAALAWWLLGMRTSAIGIPTLYLSSASIAGIALGIAIHPQSMNYISSGILMHVYAVYHSFTWWVSDATGRVSPPSEMFLLQSPPTLLQLCACGCGVFVMYLLYRYRRRSEHPWLLLIVMTASGIGLFFTFVQIFIPRATEYSIPFLALTTACTLGFTVVPVLRVTHRTLLKRGGEIGDLYRNAAAAMLSVSADTRLRVTVGSMALILTLTVPLLMHGSILAKKVPHDYTRYAEVTEYLSAQPDHLLLTDRFDLYPQLVFLAPHNKYATGMDSRFIGLYDQTLASDVAAFWNKDTCTSSTCEIPSIPESFRTHHITHVLIDANTVGKPYADAIAISPEFQLVLTDSRNPEVLLYEIVTATNS